MVRIRATRLVFFILLCTAACVACTNMAFAQDVKRLGTTFVNAFNPPCTEGMLVTDEEGYGSCMPDWRLTLGFVPAASVAPRGAGSAHTAANTYNTANSNNSQDPCATKVSDPVDVSTGYKSEMDTDFAVPVEMGLRYDRYYISHYGGGPNDSANQNGLWTTSLDYVLSGTICYDIFNGTSCPPVTYLRPDGSSLTFQSVTPTLGSQQGMALPGPFVSAGTATLTRNADNTYTVHDENSDTLVFDVNGRIESIKDPSSIGWTFSYPDSKTTVVTHTNGQSMKVVLTSGSLTGPEGSSLQTQVTDPAGNVYTYNSYNAPLDDIVSNSPSHIEVLASVIYPGAPSETDAFKYNMGYYLMTEADYNGVAKEVTTYNSTNQVAQTGLADGTQTSSFSYGGTSSNPSTTVTNPLGHTTVYNFDSNYRLTSIVGQASALCSATNAVNTYDANGNMTSSTDNNGNVTKYAYASTGLLQQKIEAAGTADQRVTDYTWDSTAGSNRPLSIKVEGFSETDYTYDSHNRLTSVTVKNLSPNGLANQPLTTSYGYQLYADGMVQIMTVMHPSPNNSDVDTYQYDTLGNLTSESDGLGHTTTFGNYNALGEPSSVTGPNGDVTDFTYDARGRVVTKTTHPNGLPAQWSYGYDVFGLANNITAPDGEVTTWNRNAVGVLQTITHNDKDGTSTEAFGYDANGDMTSDTLTRNGVVSLEKKATYDELGRPHVRQGMNGQSLTYTYDGDGNVLSITNAMGHVASFTYDALNRVTQKSESDGASPPMPSSAPSLSAPANSTNGSYGISWGAVSGATYYVLQEQLNGGSWSTVQNSAATSYTLSNQSSGTYDYRVQACNVTGCSTWSSAGQVVVLLAPSSAPTLNVPTSVVGGVYALNWSSVATATSYNLQEQFQGGAWATVYNGSSVSWNATEKLPGTYGYQVQACNSTGCGPWSPVSTVNVSVDMSPIINLILDSN